MRLYNARIIDPESETIFDGSVTIEDGFIAEISDDPAPPPGGGEALDCGNKFLSPGLIDLGVKVSEPGERHKESFGSAGQAAAAGGVTTMVTRPDTLPATDTPETLEFVTRRANEAAPVRVRRPRFSPRPAIGSRDHVPTSESTSTVNETPAPTEKPLRRITRSRALNVIPPGATIE